MVLSCPSTASTSIRLTRLAASTASSANRFDTDAAWSGVVMRAETTIRLVAVTARTLDQHDHLPGSLRETVAWIEKQGGRAVPIVGDLADAKDYDRIVAEAQGALGPIEILVNNAAAAFYLPFDKLSETRFRVAYAINELLPK